jgi:multiple sugar transport system permease protein
MTVARRFIAGVRDYMGPASRRERPNTAARSVPKISFFKADTAALDGASRWQTLWRITLPLLKPFTAVNVIIASLGAFSVFDLIYVMTQGGPFKSTNVAMVEVYLQAFQFNQFGYAAALSVLVLLLITGLSLGLLRIFRSGPAEREA